MNTNTSLGHFGALLARLSFLSLFLSLTASRVAADVPLGWSALVPNDPLVGIDAAPLTRERFTVDAATAVPPISPRTQLITRDPEAPVLLERQANLLISIHNLDASKPGSVIPPTSAAECRWLRSTDLPFWECAPQFPSKKDLAVISYRHHLTYMFAIGNAAGIAEIPDSVLDNWIGVLRAANFRRVVVQYISGGWGETGEILREWPDPNFLIAIPASLKFLPATQNAPPTPALLATTPLCLPSVFPGPSSAAPASESAADLILDVSFPFILNYSSWEPHRDSDFNISVRRPLRALSGDIDGPFFLRLRLRAIDFPQRKLAIVVLPPAIRPTPDELSFVIESLRDAGFTRISVQRQIGISRLVVFEIEQ